MNKLPKETSKSKELRLINNRERKSSRGEVIQSYTLRKDQID